MLHAAGPLLQFPSQEDLDTRRASTATHHESVSAAIAPVTKIADLEA